MSEAALMWEPSGETTPMDKFMSQVNEKFGLTLSTYSDLYAWSVSEYDKFWAEVWDFCGIVCSKQYNKVVDMDKKITDIPEWFEGSSLNFAENLLKQGNKDDKVAIYQCGEGQKVTTTTFSQLKSRVACIASALRSCGVGVGDRVVGYLPNCSVAVETMLAVSSIGAVWSSTAPDFGVSGVLDRFGQIKPKVLFSVEAVRYNQKEFWHLDKVKDVVKGLPELEKVVIVPYRGTKDIDLTNIPNSVLMEDFLKGHDKSELAFEQLPFNHPLFVMYSSGTTGPPKCMVHSQGGTLIQLLKEHVIHSGATANDVIFFYTTTAWMMWNWLVTALGSGAAIVLYDGSPFVPSPNALWDLVDELGITYFGAGAKYYDMLDEKNIEINKSHKLSTLKGVLSTASPLKPQSYDYLYSKVKKDMVVGSITGGTDIISCFAGNIPIVPVYRGEIQGRNLGMAVEAWNDYGKHVCDERAELVCVKPFPSMPVFFWNDEGGIKYKKAYFNRYPGVWCHGDFLIMNSKTGGLVMLGRSDGVLNPAGVRFGSAEIYNIVEDFPEIEDSLCIGQMVGSDERVILFLMMAKGHLFSNDVVKKVKLRIRTLLSPRHVPSIILPTTDIPYTHSGKKVEVAVKKMVAGEDVKERGAYRNPNSLDLYANLPQLKLD